VPIGATVSDIVVTVTVLAAEPSVVAGVVIATEAAPAGVTVTWATGVAGDAGLFKFNRAKMAPAASSTINKSPASNGNGLTFLLFLEISPG
jgi:hypothetical protein